MQLKSLEMAEKCHQMVRLFLDTDPVLYPSNFTHELLPSWTIPLHESVQNQVGGTFNSLVQMINKYQLEHLSISYNGGKDCLILLVIYMAAIWETYREEYSSSLIINSVYVHSEPEFHDQMDFLEKSVSMFGLNFTTVFTYDTGEFQGDDADNNSFSSQLNEDHIIEQTYAKFNTLYSLNHTLPSGFQTYLESNENIKAIVAGIRRTDPYAQTLKLEQETDGAKGWPKFIRINPVLEWNTAEVWTFVRWLDLVTNSKYNDSLPFDPPSNVNITYCKLYDEGFTSLGGRHTTIKNPGLKNDDGTYKAAWEVVDDDIERLGRNQKGKV